MATSNVTIGDKRITVNHMIPDYAVRQAAELAASAGYEEVWVNTSEPQTRGYQHAVHVDRTGRGPVLGYVDGYDTRPRRAIARLCEMPVAEKEELLVRLVPPAVTDRLSYVIVQLNHFDADSDALAAQILEAAS